MLEEILRHIKNWFLISGGIYEDDYVIENGDINLPFLQVGQYYRILGSLFNDGLHQYQTEELRPESFHGTIWALAIPRDLIQIAGEIKNWQDKNGNASPYASESFGGYSYTKATSSTTGQAVTWQDVFRTRLNPYRKIREV